MQSVDTIQSRAVNTDGAGGKLPSPVFGRTINLTQTVGGGQIMPNTLLCAPPDFQIYTSGPVSAVQYWCSIPSKIEIIQNKI